MAHDGAAGLTADLPLEVTVQDEPRTVVFADTKNDCSEMADALATLGARALHGDIPQGQREVTMAAFRKKQFRVLVATDVAARGLDVNGIELVVQLDPPKVRFSSLKPRAHGFKSRAVSNAQGRQILADFTERAGRDTPAQLSCRDLYFHDSEGHSRACTLRRSLLPPPAKLTRCCDFWPLALLRRHLRRSALAAARHHRTRTRTCTARGARAAPTRRARA